MDPDESFTAFVASRQARLLRFARLLSGDWASAEDLVQISFLKLWPRWTRLGDQQPEAYARRVIVNEAISGHRSVTRRWKRMMRAAPPLIQGDVSGDVDTRTSLDLVLQRLPAGQRAVLILRYYEDLSERETAAALGCAVGTVKSQSAKALARLRTEVETLPAPAGWPVAHVDNEEGSARGH